MTYSLASLTSSSPSLPSVIEDFATLTMKSKSSSKSEEASRLLNLIPEVRLTIWKLALPRSEKLILDPENIEVPGAIPKGDYAATASLLRVCKQTYDEVLPLIYSKNTVAVLEPWEESMNRFAYLPTMALQHITKVELRLIDGLVDMGSSGEMILAGNLPSLKYLKLNFWHARLWLRTAMELALRSWKSWDCEEPRFEFKLQLFKSVHDFDYINPPDDETIEADLVNARNQAKIYDLKVPNKLRTITLSASAGTEAAYALATYKSDRTSWRFKKDGNKDSRVVKYLVWKYEQA